MKRKKLDLDLEIRRLSQAVIRGGYGDKKCTTGRSPVCGPRRDCGSGFAKDIDVPSGCSSPRVLYEYSLP